jgi:hypothetical protein
MLLKGVVDVGDDDDEREPVKLVISACANVSGY